uniref:G-protein coupled receptors family 1 profile domain-containing protein n=1 Tax=Globodera rostochiensis TaxID=31243 RepID=A0A914HXE6_GLORO
MFNGTDNGKVPRCPQSLGVIYQCAKFHPETPWTPGDLSLYALPFPSLPVTFLSIFEIGRAPSADISSPIVFVPRRRLRAYWPMDGHSPICRGAFEFGDQNNSFYSGGPFHSKRSDIIAIYYKNLLLLLINRRTRKVLSPDDSEKHSTNCAFLFLLAFTNINRIISNFVSFAQVAFYYMSSIGNLSSSLLSSVGNNIHLNASTSLIPDILMTDSLNHSNMSTNSTFMPFSNSLNTSMRSIVPSPVESHQHPLNPYSVVNIFICAPMLLLQLLTLPIFLVYPNYRCNVCFRILFTNGVTDCLQLAPLLTFAILNLITDNIPIWFQRFGSSIVINAWNLLVMQHFLLALNRLIVILRARYLGSRFIPDQETEAKCFNVAHAFIWAVYLVIVGLHQTNLMGSLFHSGTSQFVFDIEKPLTQTVRMVFWYVTIVIPIICLVIYIVIIAFAKLSRTSMHRGDDITATKTTAPLLNDYERRLLIQAIILYVVMGLLIIAWNSFDSCRNDICVGKILRLIPVSLPRAYHTFFIEGLWMVYCGLNPILFLTMNREFRNRFLQLYGIKKSTIFPSTGHTNISRSTASNDTKPATEMGTNILHGKKK